ncbi:MAG: hypothetical protein K0T99_01385 [Alphaproteobacteria bacterium]|nr:hypothetical protein [Alphaproteobacteria bacterium]
MNHSSEEERISHLFDLVMSLFEKFVEKVDIDIMQPFLDGDFEKSNENLKSIGSKISLDKVLLLILKNFEGLIDLRISINKHYGKIQSCEDGVFDIDDASKELQLKLSSLSENMGLLAGKSLRKK